MCCVVFFLSLLRRSCCVFQLYVVLSLSLSLCLGMRKMAEFILITALTCTVLRHPPRKFMTSVLAIHTTVSFDFYYFESCI